VVIPANALKEDEPVFLDNMHISDLEHQLKVRIFQAEHFKELVALLRTTGRQNR
jgi:hypothetical protein